MIGEPSSYEYAEAIAEANRNSSDDYFKVHINNIGFSGYYVNTPFNKYVLTGSSSHLFFDGYTIHRKSEYGEIVTDEKFQTLEEAKEYIKKREEMVY